MYIYLGQKQKEERIMNQWTFLATHFSLIGIIVFMALLNQWERRKGAEREMVLIKAGLAKDATELYTTQASPTDLINRVKLENDLATKAEKLERAKEKEREKETPGVAVQ